VKDKKKRMERKRKEKKEKSKGREEREEREERKVKKEGIEKRAGAETRTLKLRSSNIDFDIHDVDAISIICYAVFFISYALNFCDLV